MEQFLKHATRKDVGAVGAKLHYPNNTIQHAGVILGILGLAGHSHKHFPRESHGYSCRLMVVQNLSAVTGACLMIRKAIFEKVNGFDEKYPIAFNDVDLCLKIRQKGYLIVWTSYVELYHHIESITRSPDNTAELQEWLRIETEHYFMEKWKHVTEKGDPYYSPNLTLSEENFSIKI